MVYKLLANVDFTLLRRWRPSFQKSSVTLLSLVIKIKPFSWQINLRKNINFIIQMKVFFDVKVMK